MEAQATILSCSIFCGAIAAIPIPVSDILLMAPAQVAMVGALARVFNRPFTTKLVLTVFGSLGVGMAARALAQNVLKLLEIAVVGGTLGAGTPAALAMGAVGVGIAVTGTIIIGETTVALLNGKCITEEEREAAKCRAEAFKNANEKVRLEYQDKLNDLVKAFEEKEISKEEFTAQTKAIQDQMEAAVRKSEVLNAIW